MQIPVKNLAAIASAYDVGVEHNLTRKGETQWNRKTIKNACSKDLGCKTRRACSQQFQADQAPSLIQFGFL